MHNIDLGLNQYSNLNYITNIYKFIKSREFLLFISRDKAKTDSLHETVLAIIWLFNVSAIVSALAI